MPTQAEAAGITVRPADRADLAGISALEKSFEAPSAYPPFFFAQALRHFGRGLIVAAYHEEVFGYVLGGGGQDGHAWNLWSLVVGEKYRGQGIGGKLLEAALQQSIRDGAPSVALTVSPKNEPAVALYRKYGFVATDHLPDEFGPAEDRILMVSHHADR